MSSEENTVESCDSFGHDDVITYEDAEVRNWECQRCGAEGYEDLEPKS